jgi:hypothetical protein
VPLTPREPAAVVFASGPSGSSTSPRTPAPEVWVAPRRGPRVVVFADDAPAPDAKTPSASTREPGVLVFSASAPPRPAESPAAKPAHPVPVPVPAPAPPSKEGAPLAFGASAPAPRNPGVPVFEKTYHPLNATVLKQAHTLGPELVQGNESRLATMAGQLLPLTTPGLESFGARALERCYQDTVETAALAKRYTILDVSKTVDHAVQAHRSGGGLRASLQRWAGPSLAEHRTRIVTVRASLASILEELRPLLVRAAWPCIGWRCVAWSRPSARVRTRCWCPH